MDNNLEILVTLKDEASAAFKNVSKNVSSASADMSNHLGILSTDVTGLSRTLLAGTLAAGGIAVAFGVSAIKSFATAEVAISRVDATLRTMGQSALKNRDAILQAADASIRLGFDDEDSAESVTRLYQRTGNLTTAMQLNNIAMDLSRAKHIELLEATTLVGQVLSGNGRLLKQYGIEISDTLTPLQALGELQDQVAGQADAFSQTFEGQMEVLTVNFQNIKEAIGGALVEALTPFITQFTAWLMNPDTKKQLAEWTEEFKSWAEVIIPTIVETFKIWFNWASKLASALIQVGNAMKDIADLPNKVANSKGGQMIGGAFNQLKTDVSNGYSIMGKAVGLADGGIVTGPTLAVVGEGGGPEAVIPLDKLGSMGAGNITVNLSGQFVTDEENARNLGNMIAKAIGQQLKLKSY